MNISIQFVLTAKRILRELSDLAETLRAGFFGVQTQVEKISRQVESATREYYAKSREEKPTPIMRGELRRPQSEIDNEEAYKSRVEGRDTKRLIVESLALGLAGALAIATIGLWLITRQSTRIASMAADAAQRGAKASEAQARAAEASVNATVSAFRLDQRAWVSVKKLSLSAEPAANRPCTVILDLINYGKTPALRVWNMPTNAHIVEHYGGTFYPPYIEKPNDMTGGYYLLPPGPIGSKIHARCEPPTPAELSSYFQGKSNFYVASRIYYADIFKRGHWTNVCAYHIYGTPLDLFFFCSKENEADEDE